MRTTIGLFVVGIGETIADFGARVARVRRKHSLVVEIDEVVAYEIEGPFEHVNGSRGARGLFTRRG